MPRRALAPLALLALTGGLIGLQVARSPRADAVDEGVADDGSSPSAEPAGDASTGATAAASTAPSAPPPAAAAETPCTPTDDLVLTPESLAELGPCLARVPGTLRLELDPSQTALLLPALESVGSLEITGGALETITAPQLATITGDLSLRDQAALQSLSMPALVEVGGSLSLEGLPSLTNLDLPALAVVVEGFTLRDAPAMTLLRLADLRGVGDVLLLEDLPALRQLSLPTLESAAELAVLQTPSLLGVNVSELPEDVPRRFETDDAEPGSAEVE